MQLKERLAVAVFALGVLGFSLVAVWAVSFEMKRYEVSHRRERVSPSQGQDQQHLETAASGRSTWLLWGQLWGQQGMARLDIPSNNR